MNTMLTHTAKAMVASGLVTSGLGSSLDLQAMQNPEDQPPKMSNGEGLKGEAEATFVESDVQQAVIPSELEVMTNGINQMPPQQVYVSSEAGMQGGITGLESQLMGLQMNPPGVNEETTQDGEDDDNDDLEEYEIEPVKLFVGQVPKNMSEEDLFPTFNAFGPLKDVAIIRDKHSGLHRGCAFVTYWSPEDAENAQQSLHDQYTFPGGRRPAQVKPAEPSVPENKLFIGMLSREATEDEVKELFETYGEIREIYMIRNADGSSRCSAFLRFVKRDAAVKAITSLHNNVVMEGAARPLIVKFADNKQQRNARHMQRSGPRDNNMMPMGPGGPPYPGYVHQGLPPQMGMHPHHPGHQYAMPPYPGPYGAGQPPGPGHHPYAMYPPFGPPPYAFQNRQDMPGHNPRPREGPAGANLFVYHLPHDLTDADLATAFNPFGNVISAKVYVDKYTGESKGFGFVSYDSVMSAESAIEQMNGFQIGNKRLKVQHKRVNTHAHEGMHHHHHLPPPQPYPVAPS